MLRRKSERQKEKDIVKKAEKEEMWKFFEEIWKERPHICSSCKRYLGQELKSAYMDHLLEKTMYPEFALLKDNIYICCLDCHYKKTNGWPTEHHQKAINDIKLKLGL